MFHSHLLVMWVPSHPQRELLHIINVSNVANLIPTNAIIVTTLRLAFSVALNPMERRD